MNKKIIENLLIIVDCKNKYLEQVAEQISDFYETFFKNVEIVDTNNSAPFKVPSDFMLEGNTPTVFALSYNIEKIKEILVQTNAYLVINLQPSDIDSKLSIEALTKKFGDNLKVILTAIPSLYGEEVINKDASSQAEIPFIPYKEVHGITIIKYAGTILDQNFKAEYKDIFAQLLSGEENQKEKIERLRNPTSDRNYPGLHNHISPCSLWDITSPIGLKQFKKYYGK